MTVFGGPTWCLECLLIVLLPAGYTMRTDGNDHASGERLKKNDGSDRVLWPYLVPCVFVDCGASGWRHNEK